MRGAARTLRAATADVPDAVRQEGAQAVDLFRDAILRGLSPSDARAYAASPDFRRQVGIRNLLGTLAQRYGSLENIPSSEFGLLLNASREGDVDNRTLQSINTLIEQKEKRVIEFEANLEGRTVALGFVALDQKATEKGINAIAELHRAGWNLEIFKDENGKPQNIGGELEDFKEFFVETLAQDLRDSYPNLISEEAAREYAELNFNVTFGLGETVASTIVEQLPFDIPESQLLADLATIGAAAGIVFPAARLGGRTVPISNPVPETFARVVPGHVNPRTLGQADDVFVIDAEALKGLSSKQIAERLSIPESSTGFKIIEFP